METSSLGSGRTVMSGFPALLGSDTSSITSRACPAGAGARAGTTTLWRARLPVSWPGPAPPSAGRTRRTGANPDVHVHPQRLVARDRAEDVVGALLQGHGELRALARLDVLGVRLRQSRPRDLQGVRHHPLVDGHEGVL